MTNNELTKSLPVSKQMVWEGYQQVKQNGGSAGIDQQSIKMFDANLSGNLYKLWNRLSSGSYFPPPVRTVFIPKKQGGKRPLGIPTVSDRIAQTVVKQYLEPMLDGQFHPNSFGYRPGKRAHDAVEQCRQNCWQYAWVIDIDIKGYFDNIDHGILKQMLQGYVRAKWVMMCIERWLQAGVEQEDGSIAKREKGRPQGGVISPLLANLYLHECFDKWMVEIKQDHLFERYADDIVVHCVSKESAEWLLESIGKRMRQYGLELHPEKTKIVYCKNERRGMKHDNESFTFLGFDFQPKIKRSKNTGLFLCYWPSIGRLSKKKMREEMQAVVLVKDTEQSLEAIAKRMNSKLRGWVNYYGKFDKWEMYDVLWYLNKRLVKWVKNKYRVTSIKDAVKKYQELKHANPKLFYHWRLGIN